MRRPSVQKKIFTGNRRKGLSRKKISALIARENQQEFPRAAAISGGQRQLLLQRNRIGSRQAQWWGAELVPQA